MTKVPMPAEELVRFGKLLRDRRSGAGLSRVELAHKAKLSDATIKFIETARHPPSRWTLIRLVGVRELNLTWNDVPGSMPPPQSASPDQHEQMALRGFIHVDHCLRATGATLNPTALVGCRQAREIFVMLTRVLEASDASVKGDSDTDLQRYFYEGAAAALGWLLGNLPPPLLNPFLDSVSRTNISQVFWLARLGASALGSAEPTNLGGRLAGIATALEWVLQPEAAEPFSPAPAPAES